MHLTQVYTIYWVLPIKVIVANAAACDRINRHSLLDKPIQKHSPRPRSSAIETKGELVEIIFQVGHLDSPLMRALVAFHDHSVDHDPSLQIAPDQAQDSLVRDPPRDPSKPLWLVIFIKNNLKKPTF